jgi:SAM-dependent methyltransferase
LAEGALKSGIVTAAFDAVAETYDDVFTQSCVGLAQRAAVHRELDRAFRPGQHVLEINCGTGVDAVYLACRGVRVLACDASARMIEVARRRAARDAIDTRPEFRVLPTERIGALLDTEGHAQFDGAFSNFAGLNCVEDLSAVARELAMLLKPGATALFCVFGRLCLWEIFWYLGQGKPRKAFRRFHAKGDTARLAENVMVHVHYPAVRTLAQLFLPQFQFKGWKGVGVAVPPTYLESVMGRFPEFLRALATVDRGLGSCPGLRGMADHALVKLERSRT